jgi:hypothetical protein
MDCEPRSSAGIAFSPATVNFNEYAWPVSSSRRQISIQDDCVLVADGICELDGIA